jgi:hypothetical protein
MLGDDFAGDIFAAATATADGKLALHLKQRAGTAIDGIANLTVTHCVTDANVHVGPSSIRPPERLFMGQYYCE